MNTHIDYPDRSLWRQEAATFADYSYRQVWDFGLACAKRLGADSEHVAIRRDGARIGLADVRIRRLPVIGSGIAYINGGPLVRRNGSEDSGRLRDCLRALIDEYVRNRGLLLRIQPAVGSPDWNAAQEAVFAELGFDRAQRWPVYRTLLVPIDRPPEQIRKSFDQKWRNGLNRAERNALQVDSGTDRMLFGEFCSLYHQMLSRKKFGVDLDADFYADIQRHMDEPDRLVVSLVRVAGEPVAGHVASALGDTCVYLLGAGNEVGMQCKASYLLQWQAIEGARQRGCRWYDLGGIDVDGNPGVYHFKQGLGGLDLTAPGPYERPPTGLRHHIVGGCERMYRSIRTMRLGAGLGRDR